MSEDKKNPIEKDEEITVSKEEAFKWAIDSLNVLIESADQDIEKYKRSLSIDSNNVDMQAISKAGAMIKRSRKNKKMWEEYKSTFRCIRDYLNNLEQKEENLTQELEYYKDKYRRSNSNKTK